VTAVDGVTLGVSADTISGLIGPVVSLDEVRGLWIEAEPFGRWLPDVATSWLDPANPVRLHLLAQAARMRLVVMGVVLLATLRFAHVDCCRSACDVDPLARATAKRGERGRDGKRRRDAWRSPQTSGIGP